jgi:hypothetical protein
MSFSWDCYRETLFEQELWMLDHLPPKTYQESERDIIHRYLEERLKEIKKKYKE